MRVTWIQSLFFDDADQKERISFSELFDVFTNHRPPQELPEKLKILLSHLLEIEQQTEIRSGCKHTEVYKNTNLGDNRRLCTLRLNDRARLFYATHDNLFFPLGVTWTHDIEQHPLLDPNVQRDVGDAISKAVLELQQATQAMLSVSAAASPVVSPKKSYSPKSRRLSEKQEEILTQSDSKSVVMVAPAGAGKSLIAVKKLIAQICAGIPVTYIVPTVLLRERVKKDVQQEIITNGLDKNDLASYAVKTWDEWAAELSVAEGLMPGADLKPVNFDYFLMWYQQHQKKKDAPKVYDAKLLYNELVHIILNPNQELSEFFISEAAYSSLESARSFVAADDRQSVYRFLQRYLQYISNAEQLAAAGFYHAHKLHFIILKKMMDQKTKPQVITSLIVDELQCLGSSQIMILLVALGADVVEPRNIFFCGDPNQLCGRNPRLIERTKQLVQTYCRVPPEMILTSVLEMSFRSSRSVSLFANRMLQLINSFGSDERISTYGLNCSMNAENGEINVCDVAQLKQLFEQYAASGITNCVVIVPDDYQISDKDRSQFGHIVKLQETRGCEYRHVFLHGFFDHALRLLDTEKSQLSLDVTAAPQFLRNKEVAQRASSSATVIALQMLYLAETRACNTCTLVNIQSGTLKAMVAEIRSFIEAKRTNSAVEKIEQSCEAIQQVITVETKMPISPQQPLESLEDIKRFSETYAPESLHAVLWSARIWGTRELACQAKLFFASCGNDFKAIFPLVEHLLQCEEKERVQWLNMSGRPLSSGQKLAAFQAIRDGKTAAQFRETVRLQTTQKDKSVPEVPVLTRQAETSLPAPAAPPASVVSMSSEQKKERAESTVLINLIITLAAQPKCNARLLADYAERYYLNCCVKGSSIEYSVIFITIMLGLHLMGIEITDESSSTTATTDVLKIFWEQPEDIATRALIALAKHNVAICNAIENIVRARKNHAGKIIVLQLIACYPVAMMTLLKLAERNASYIREAIMWALPQKFTLTEGDHDHTTVLYAIARFCGAAGVSALPYGLLPTIRSPERANILKCILLELPAIHCFTDNITAASVVRTLLRLTDDHLRILENAMAEALPQLTCVGATILRVMIRLGGAEGMLMLTNLAKLSKAIQDAIAAALLRPEVKLKSESGHCFAGGFITLEAIITDSSDIVLRALIEIIKNSDVIQAAVLKAVPLFRKTEHLAALLNASKGILPEPFLEALSKKTSLARNSTFFASGATPMQTATSSSQANYT